MHTCLATINPKCIVRLNVAMQTGAVNVAMQTGAVNVAMQTGGGSMLPCKRGRSMAGQLLETFGALWIPSLSARPPYFEPAL